MRLPGVLAIVVPVLCAAGGVLVAGGAVAGPQDSCAALGYPPGVCAATWDAVGVWTMQFKVGTAVGAPRGAASKNAVTAWFRGSIAGGVLTVTGEGRPGGSSCPYASGPIAVGQYIYGPGVPPGTYVEAAGQGRATCGGSASGYGQDASSWTLSDGTLTVGSEIMVSGGDRAAGVELPTAPDRCGMPRVPIHEKPDWGSILFGAGPGGCTLDGWDFRGVSVAFYAKPVPGNDNPVVYRDNACDFTGNIAGAGARTFTCFSSTGFNKVTVADNSMDLTHWGGGSGRFGIFMRGTTATTSTVSGNWIKNSPANSIVVTGYTTISGNFLDKTGCGNGAHPDTIAWYGFDDKATGSSVVHNFAIIRNLVDYANCGTFIAAAGWTGGAKSLTLTTAVTPDDLTRYGGQAFSGGDLFAVDATTGRLVGQVASVEGATVNLQRSIGGNRLYRQFAEVPGSKGDQILLVMGTLAKDGWSTGDTRVAVDSCVTGIPAGVNDDTPFLVVPNDGSTTEVVNDYVKAGGCATPTEMSMFSRPPWGIAMKHDRPAGTIMLYTVGAVSAFRPLLTESTAQKGLIQHNIVAGGDPHGRLQIWQTAVGVQSGGVAMSGVEVKDNLWTNAAFCQQSGGAIAFQSNNRLLPTGAAADPCPERPGSKR